jgi:hypothetical protein
MSSAVAPLVAGRSIRAGLSAAPGTHEPAAPGEPSLVVARLASTSWDAGAADLATSAVSTGSVAPFGGATRPAAPSAASGAARVAARPVVARAAIAAGRDPAVARSSDMALARAGSSAGSAANAGADEAAHDHAVGALGWAAGAGFTTIAAPPVPFVQRAVTIDEVSVTPGGAAAGATQSGGPGSGGQAGAGGAGTDYEELAEHVYDKIRARLTTELLLDRERAGMLVDG